MTPTLSQLRAIAADASMLVEDVDGSWVEHVADLRVEGERLPSELACHIEEFSPAQALALLDRIDRLERCLAAALDLCARGGGFPEDRAAIRKELSHAD